MTTDNMPDALRQALITVIDGSAQAFAEASKTLAHWRNWNEGQRRTHLRVITTLAAAVPYGGTGDDPPTREAFRRAVAVIADAASR